MGATLVHRESLAARLPRLAFQNGRQGRPLTAKRHRDGDESVASAAEATDAGPCGQVSLRVRVRKEEPLTEGYAASVDPEASRGRVLGEVVSSGDVRTSRHVAPVAAKR